HPPGADEPVDRQASPEGRGSQVTRLVRSSTCGKGPGGPFPHARPLLTAVLASLSLAVVPAGGARTADVLPTLYVAYTMHCTFAITDDSGRRVASIPPGTYQVLVTTPMVFADVDLSGIFDMTACKGFVQFQLTGPGVNLQTTLQDGDEDKEMLRGT